MTDQCQHLEYRPLSGAGDSDAAEPRAYCTAADRFVQPMRADICNRRYGLDPETDCEFYREAEGLPEAPGGEGAPKTTDRGGGGGRGAGGGSGAGDTDAGSD